MTARWVVDVVQPERDLDVTWQPISLLKKNDPDPDSPYFAPVQKTHNMLRVMESLRAADGDDAAFKAFGILPGRLRPICSLMSSSCAIVGKKSMDSRNY